MIDTVQAVLLFVIVILTILFLVLGIQVFYILKDLRVTLRRTNKILDNVENLSEGVSSQIGSFSKMFAGASVMGTAAKIFSMFVKRKKD